MFEFFPLTSSGNTSSCFQFCTCAGTRNTVSNEYFLVVDCSGTNLSSVPADRDHRASKVEVLHLNNNRIEALRETSFTGFEQVQELDLSSNSISDLGNAFFNLSDLRYLNLSGNRLTGVFGRDFDRLDKLVSLVLSRNRLTELGVGCFAGLRSLQDLQMTGNKLVSVPEGIFSRMAALRTLDLDENQIAEIHDGAFDGSVNLSKLTLARNRIFQLPVAIFVRNDVLEYLNVSRNMLHTVPKDLLKVLRNLKGFDMDGNPVERIYSRDFDSLPSLRELSVGFMPELLLIDEESIYNMSQLKILRLNNNSRLSFVDSNSVVKCPRLRSIFLHGGNISTVPRKLVCDPDDLRIVSLWDNPLRCDCNMRWLKDVTETDAITDCSNNSASCSSSESGGSGSKKSQCGSWLSTPASELRCVTPVEFNGLTFDKLRSKFVPAFCRPVIVTMSNVTTYRRIGDRFNLHCRATGYPVPSIRWTVIANSRIINRTLNNARITIESTGSLSVDAIQASDAGWYTCTAVNDAGSDASSSALRIYNQKARVVIRALDSSSVTVTWTGVDATMKTVDYVIIYRRINSSDTGNGSSSTKSFVTLRIGPFMRKYTFNGLLSQHRLRVLHGLFSYGQFARWRCDIVRFAR